MKQLLLYFDRMKDTFYRLTLDTALTLYFHTKYKSKLNRICWSVYNWAFDQRCKRESTT